jgi:hypothetical protein
MEPADSSLLEKGAGKDRRGTFNACILLGAKLVNGIFQFDLLNEK